MIKMKMQWKAGWSEDNIPQITMKLTADKPFEVQADGYGGPLVMKKGESLEMNQTFELSMEALLGPRGYKVDHFPEEE